MLLLPLLLGMTLVLWMMMMMRMLTVKEVAAEQVTQLPIQRPLGGLQALTSWC
jgi:hypothetical protein